MRRSKTRAQFMRIFIGEFAEAEAKAVEKMRADRDTQSATRETAEIQSKECDRSGGSGFAAVFHPAPSLEHSRPKSITATCVCALGKFNRGCYGPKQRDVTDRLPELATVIAGKPFQGVVWLLDAPDLGDTEETRAAYLGNLYTPPAPRRTTAVPRPQEA